MLGNIQQAATGIELDVAGALRDLALFQVPCCLSPLVQPPAQGRVSSKLRHGCLGQYPAGAWKLPGKETAQPLRQLVPLPALMGKQLPFKSSLNLSCLNPC